MLHKTKPMMFIQKCREDVAGFAVGEPSICLRWVDYKGSGIPSCYTTKFGESGQRYFLIPIRVLSQSEFNNFLRLDRTMERMYTDAKVSGKRDRGKFDTMFSKYIRLIRRNDYERLQRLNNSSSGTFYSPIIQDRAAAPIIIVNLAYEQIFRGTQGREVLPREKKYHRIFLHTFNYAIVEPIV